MRRFLEEAVRCFGTHGYYGVSIREIAEGVGVKPSALYAHLPSKEAVLERIMTIAHDYFGHALEQAASGSEGPQAQLRAVVKANVSFHASYPRLAMVANHELRALPRDALVRIMRQRAGWEELVQRIIRDGNNQGLFHCPDPELGAKALGGMCIRVAAWIEQDPNPDLERIAEFYADFVTRALTGPIVDARSGGTR